MYMYIYNLLFDIWWYFSNFNLFSQFVCIVYYDVTYNIHICSMHCWFFFFLSSDRVSLTTSRSHWQTGGREGRRAFVFFLVCMCMVIYTYTMYVCVMNMYLYWYIGYWAPAPAPPLPHAHASRHAPYPYRELLLHRSYTQTAHTLLHARPPSTSHITVPALQYTYIHTLSPLSPMPMTIALSIYTPLPSRRLSSVHARAQG